MIAPILALGIPALAAAVFFAVCKRWETRGCVAVVDNRTLKLAERRVTEMLAAGDVEPARYAMTAAILWLRDEARFGPRRHRIKRAAQLEQWELRRAQLAHPAGVER